MKRTTIYLDGELEARLKAEVARLGVPMAAYIRESIAQRLGESERRRSPFAGAFSSGRHDIAEKSEDLLTDLGQE